MKRIFAALLVMTLAAPAVALWMIPTSAFSESNSWQFYSFIDEIDDSRISVASTYISLGLKTTELKVRCINGSLAVIASFGEYLGDNLRPVVYRFDEKAPNNSEWAPSAEGTSLFADNAELFAKGLLIANRIIIQAQDFRGVRFRVKFDLAGSKNAIEPVLTLCGIDPTVTDLDSVLTELRAPTDELRSPTNAPDPDQITLILRNVERLKNEPEEQQNDMVRAILKQLFSCWRLDPGAERAEDMVVEIRVALNPDGSIQRAEIVDVARMSRDGYFRSTAENAKRAIYKCSPFRLPPNKYQIWRELNLRFNPREMFEN
jgi:hypothetical protein